MTCKGLSGNLLKIIAMITMTVDHVGAILFPRCLWLRLVGRLSMPIYAFLIAEGCRHTRSMPKYLASVAAMALLCQVVYYAALGSLYQCILVTYTLSIGLTFLLQQAKKRSSVLWWLSALAAIGIIWFLTEILPLLLPGTDYGVDYGFLGVMLPVVIWLAPTKGLQLAFAAAVLLLMSLSNPLQIPALAAVGLLALYNGQRGRWNMKRFFYWYYPMHLLILYLISAL